jgi:hypothetical protein
MKDALARSARAAPPAGRNVSGGVLWDTHLRPCSAECAKRTIREGTLAAGSDGRKFVLMRSG